MQAAQTFSLKMFPFPFGSFVLVNLLAVVKGLLNFIFFFGAVIYICNTMNATNAYGFFYYYFFYFRMKPGML